MVVRLLMTKNLDGAVEVDWALGPEQMDSLGEKWAERIEDLRSAIEFPTPGDRTPVVALGVATVDVPDEDVEAAFARYERAMRQRRVASER